MASINNTKEDRDEIRKLIINYLDRYSEIVIKHNKTISVDNITVNFVIPRSDSDVD